MWVDTGRERYSAQVLLAFSLDSEATGRDPWCRHPIESSCPRRIARRPNSLDISVDGKASPRNVKTELGDLVDMCQRMLRRMW